MILSQLFHVSEEAGISRFEPRPVAATETRFEGPAGWAIDLEHLPNYLVPRDCPRVTFTGAPITKSDDRSRFFGPSQAKRIIASQARLAVQALETPEYGYELPPATFQRIDVHAGHFISLVVVVPLGVRRVEKPLAEMLAHDVELRVVRHLLALHEQVMRSTLSFSSTRLRKGADTPG